MSEPLDATSTSAESEPLLGFLSDLTLFSKLPQETLVELATQAERVILRGGETLFEQGDPSDALYILYWGRLAAWRRNAEGERRTLGHIAPGGYVGETGLLLDEPRTASVMALRDSELLRWSKTGFEQLMAQYPQAMLRLAREALARYAKTVNRPAQARCFAVLPGVEGVDAAGFAARLASALGHLGEVRIVCAEHVRDCGPGWYAELEQQTGGVVYVGDMDAGWRDRCVRQSDVVLMLVDTSVDPSEVMTSPATVSEHTPLHLVLLQHGSPPYCGTRRWLEAFSGLTLHHHVRDDEDLGRVTRLLAGRATGLVLSGGGARGFAHVGALRALREAGVRIDYVAGCSAGAIVAAGIAAEWDDTHLVTALRAGFVDDNPLSDITLPLVAIHSGGKASMLLRRAFGRIDIEDLPLPFFCVSSDLTNGVLHVHERGRVWLALRASSAIPGVVPPLFHDHRVLVDGGVLDNLPVAEMRRRLGGEIIAIDVGGNYRIETELEQSALPSWWRQILLQWRKRPYPSIAQIMWRAMMVNSDATSARQRSQSSLLLKPDLSGIDLFDWKKFDHIVHLGHESALKHLPAIKALAELQEPDVSEGPPPRIDSAT